MDAVNKIFAKRYSGLGHKACKLWASLKKDKAIDSTFTLAEANKRIDNKRGTDDLQKFGGNRNIKFIEITQDKDLYRIVPAIRDSLKQQY